MNSWYAFLKEEKKLARGTDEKSWQALPRSLTDNDKAEILAAAAKLGMTVARNSKTGPLVLTWN